MPVTEIARIDQQRSKWDEAFYAFLAEKERRSGSTRTVSSGPSTLMIACEMSKVCCCRRIGPAAWLMRCTKSGAWSWRTPN